MNDQIKVIRESLAARGLTARHINACLSVSTFLRKNKAAVIKWQRAMSSLKPRTVWFDADSYTKAWEAENQWRQYISCTIGIHIGTFLTSTDTFRVMFHNPDTGVFTVVKIWMKRGDTLPKFGSVKMWHNIPSWEVIARWNSATRIVSDTQKLIPKALPDQTIRLSMVALVFAQGVLYPFVPAGIPVIDAPTKLS